ncbi:MAG: DUF255 domain-containing protein [Cyanobacteria bacterium]|nr:DUF255 domain-containing protein [Cyanobacteriota bacterium]
MAIRAAETQSGLHWQSYSQAAFQQAAREKKLVILDLQAVWCHWCHVMEATTYQDPAVKRLLQEKFVFIQADQDARPDLALRYRDYGWPATVILSPDGTDIVKRAGYITPSAMVHLLEAVIQDPTPERTDPNDTAVSVLEDSESDKGGPDQKPARDSDKVPFSLSKKQRERLTNAFFDGFDTDQGAWGHGSHKFLDPDSVEYAMLKAQSGDVIAGKMAQKTLNAQIQLLDPVWGGMYQYSTGGVWTHPHFEKIMSVQAENIRIYAAAYSQFKDPRYLKTAETIASYLTRFLQGANGAFYVSQDADPRPGEHAGGYFKLSDAARRKRGIPRVDTHQYARENGWAIEALCTLYQASGKSVYLNQALKAAYWAQEHRAEKAEETLGFFHNQPESNNNSPSNNSQTGIYLGDTLAMGRAFTALYLSTGERLWLVNAEKTARFIEQHFRSPTAGYFVAARTETPAVKNRDENVSLVRWLNLLGHLTGNAEQAEMARHGMRWLVQPSIADIPFSASTLLPDYEVTHAPLHVTVVGGKTDPQARQLFKAALNYPSTYKRLDWWDKAEGPMPNPDVQYPTLEKPAAFVCTQNRCSIPVFDSMKLPGLIDRLSHRKQSNL